MAELGNSVVCLDTDARKIAALLRGELHFYEPHLHEMIASNHHAGALAFSEDIEAGVRDSGIVFIAVGTPKDHDDNADLSAIWNTAATIARDLIGPKIIRREIDRAGRNQ